MRGTLILIATFVILAAAGYARFFLAPIAFALFIAALVWPMQSALQRQMPQLVALAMVTLTIVVVFVLFGSLIAWSFGRVGRGVINDAARFQVLYDQLTNWLESHGIVLARLWAEHFNASWLVRLVQSATTRLNTTLSFWMIVLIYLVLGLLEIDAFGQRVRRMSNQAAARVIHDGTEAAAAKLRSYMLVRTLMSLLTGFLVWVFAAAIGLNYAAEWGVIAFVLNYVPFIGSFIATLLPTLFALAICLMAGPRSRCLSVSMSFSSWSEATSSRASAAPFLPYRRSSYWRRCSSGPSCGDCLGPSSAFRS